MKLRIAHIPLRLVTGAFILNSGLSHLGMEDEKAAGLHGMATGAFPELKRLDPKPFGQVLAISETALGAALLIPVVPTTLAGLGLGAFSGSLLALYARTPQLHREGSLLPSDQGIAVAKDVWMAGIAAALLIDQVVASRTSRTRRRLRRRVAATQERLGVEQAARDRAVQARRGVQQDLVRARTDLVKAEAGRRVERTARRAATTAAKRSAKLGAASTAKVGSALIRTKAARRRGKRRSSRRLGRVGAMAGLSTT